MAKELGQVFTPYWCVNLMIKKFNGNLLESKILEPSFGDGGFLIPLIREFILMGRKNCIDDVAIMKMMNSSIYGSEIDKKYFNYCKMNVEALYRELNFKGVFPINCKNRDAFSLKEKNFDFVIGNPPYVRIQELSNESKLLKESSGLITGNSDLFLFFTENAINKLNNKGEMIFIIPNSILYSKSSLQLRKYILSNFGLSVYNFESFQVFSDASVYTNIIHVGKKVKNKYYNFVSSKPLKFKVDDLVMQSDFIIPKKSQLKKEIIVPTIKNGCATMSDSIFICKDAVMIDEMIMFNGHLVESEMVVDMWKISKFEKYRSIFPYRIVNGEIVKLNEDELEKEFPGTYAYLLKHKKKLSKRSLEKNTKWFEFGRSQAIKDFTKEKLIVKALINPNKKTIEYKNIGSNSLCYSGLYSTSESINELNDKKAFNAIWSRSKDLRGGYKTFSSNVVKSLTKIN